MIIILSIITSIFFTFCMLIASYLIKNKVIGMQYSKIQIGKNPPEEVNVIIEISMNAGPNSTTFLLSGEVFPTAIRASGAGLSAGIAKTGAILGVFILPIWQEKLGLSTLLYGLVGCCIVAAILTYLLKVDLSDC